MYFTWIGAFIINVVTYFLGQITIKKFRYAVTIPLYIFYFGLIIASWGLFLTALIYMTNSIFDLLSMIDNSTDGVGTGGSETFKCFYYLLDALGIADGLKAGVALLVSDILVVITLRASYAVKDTTKELIDVTDKILLK